MNTQLALCVLALSTLAAGCAGEPAVKTAQPTVLVPERAMADIRRGQLLYKLACAECHGVQVHWRDQRLVDDWPSLIFQVTRWQEIAGQKWKREEIEDVAAYLNTEFYRVPCPIAGCLADRVGSRTSQPLARLQTARDAF